MGGGAIRIAFRDERDRLPGQPAPTQKVYTITHNEFRHWNRVENRSKKLVFTKNGRQFHKLTYTLTVTPALGGTTSSTDSSSECFTVPTVKIRCSNANYLVFKRIAKL